jgi:hypothetical protein
MMTILLDAALFAGCLVLGFCVGAVYGTARGYRTATREQIHQRYCLEAEELERISRL